MVERIRVGVFDDDEIFRRGIVACLEEDGVVEIAITGPSGRSREAAGAAIDVAVATPAVLRQWRPSCRVVICAGGAADAATIPRHASDQVTAVFARQSVAPDQVIDAVRAAAGGAPAGDLSRSGSRQ